MIFTEFVYLNVKVVARGVCFSSWICFQKNAQNRAQQKKWETFSVVEQNFHFPWKMQTSLKHYIFIYDAITPQWRWVSFKYYINTHTQKTNPLPTHLSSTVELKKREKLSNATESHLIHQHRPRSYIHHKFNDLLKKKTTKQQQQKSTQSSARKNFASVLYLCYALL